MTINATRFRSGCSSVFGIDALYDGGFQMQLGMIGLGRMGVNMVGRLLKAGNECVVYDERDTVR